MKIFVKRFSRIALALMSFSFLTANATTFTLPPQNEALLGKVQSASTSFGQTPGTLGQEYNVGVNAIVDANPGVSETTRFTSSKQVKVATQFLLPSLPRKGIIVNLPEMRMYYFPEGSNAVMTYPIGIGKVGKTIPITNTSVIRKVVNPTWRPTPAIREFNQGQGINLPEVMGPGPDNPLGPYAIYLGVPTYLIHSTIFPESIGRRASFGCIRMNESDIKQFFPIIAQGTRVTIIDMPNKVGWQDETLYLESHPALEERTESASLAGVMQSIQSNLPAKKVALIDWQLVAYLSEGPDGIPHDVGVILN